MKKLLISLCCVLVMMSLLACSKKTGIEDANKNHTEESKSDINNLFNDIEEIESVITMRIDIRYTLNTENQISELMKLLESIEYTEYDTDAKDKSEAEKITGSSDSGISLTFVYKDGSERFLEFSTTEDGELAEYTETSDDPYMRKDSEYNTDVEIWRDVLLIMLKGEMKDLNKK